MASNVEVWLSTLNSDYALKSYRRKVASQCSATELVLNVHLILAAKILEALGSECSH
jgi:hypothetical protein